MCQWAEHIKSGDLHRLFGSFCIKMPDDPDKLSFTKDILGESKIAEFVEEIRNLARSVALYKYLSDEEKKPGTVYVYEVIAKYIENQVVIEEKVMNYFKCQLVIPFPFKCKLNEIFF